MPKIYPYPLPDALIRQITDIGRFLTTAYPDDWRNAHNGSEPSGSTFVRRWALACRDAGIDVGVNGKRGTETLSQDVLTLGVQSGAAQDTSGTVPSLVIADVIAGAGGPSPSVGWNDVSAAAPGRYIDPWLEPSEQPGPAPEPPPPGGTTPPPNGGTTPPVLDEARFRILNEKLDQILAGQAEAKEQQSQDTQQIGRWIEEQSQGVIAALTNEIHALNFRCNFRSPFRSAEGTTTEATGANGEEADVDLHRQRPRGRKPAPRTATHKK